MGVPGHEQMGSPKEPPPWGSIRVLQSFQALCGDLPDLHQQGGPFWRWRLLFSFYRQAPRLRPPVANRPFGGPPIKLV